MTVADCYLHDFIERNGVKLQDKKVIAEIDGIAIPWVGTHKNVIVWWVVKTGHAIGFNENIAVSYSFPIKKLNVADFKEYKTVIWDN